MKFAVAFVALVASASAFQPAVPAFARQSVVVFNADGKGPVM
jgi:hypothetical protein